MSDSAGAAGGGGDSGGDSKSLAGSVGSRTSVGGKSGELASVSVEAALDGGGASMSTSSL